MLGAGPAGGPAMVRVRLFVTGIALNRSESRRDGGFKHSWSFSIVLTCPESPGRVLLRFSDPSSSKQTCSALILPS
uniref:Uncharacterized protein n=1 Tax=Poecilia reticulata TaxID=8081 RepID=A0A3P9PGZ3_POERE